MISQCFHTSQYPFHINSTCYTEGLHVSYMEVVPHTATSMHFPMVPHSFRMFHATSTCRVEYSAMGLSELVLDEEWCLCSAVRRFHSFVRLTFADSYLMNLDFYVP